ncbi:MAG: ATP-binding protein, partial [Blastocatellia bacterium]
LYELVIKGSIVYATFAVLFLVVYTYGIRHLDAFLVKRFDIRAGVVEGLLILATFAAAGPLIRLIDRAVRGLFANEIELYRDVVRKMAAATSGGTAGGRGAGQEAQDIISDLGALISYAEDTIRIGLELSRVKVIVLDGEPPSENVKKVVDKLTASRVSMLELDEDVAAIGGAKAYSLVRQGRLVGLMVVAAEPGTLTSEKRAVLEVLAGQVAAGVETFRLIGEKIKLERELALRERLAALGQMAATVAHEVKNPLSSIKSIAQVMREDDAIKEYNRDLDLIIDEVDRLSRTVSQLLAFARKGGEKAAHARQGKISDLLATVAALVAADAKRAGVKVRTIVSREANLSVRYWEPLKEIVPNLMLNAIQSSTRGNEVDVEISLKADFEDAHLPPTAEPRVAASHLILRVTDSGPGISPDDQVRIFEPFYTTRPRGTGLGLAIVRRRVS